MDTNTQDAIDLAVCTLPDCGQTLNDPNHDLDCGGHPFTAGPDATRDQRAAAARWASYQD